MPRHRLPIQVFGYRLPADLVAVGILDVISDVVWPPNIAAACQVSNRLPNSLYALLLAVIPLKSAHLFPNH